MTPCEACKTPQPARNLVRYYSTVRDEYGFVCRPDLWYDDRTGTTVVRRGHRPLRDPCFRLLMGADVHPVGTPDAARETLYFYPIRPGTVAWDQLLAECNVTKIAA